MENIKLNGLIKNHTSEGLIVSLYDEKLISSVNKCKKLITKLLTGRVSYWIFSFNELFDLLMKNVTSDLPTTDKLLDNLRDQNISNILVEYTSNLFEVSIKYARHTLPDNIEYYTYVDDFYDVREYLFIRRSDLSKFIDSLK